MSAPHTPPPASTPSLEELSAENRRLKEALRPFVKFDTPATWRGTSWENDNVGAVLHSHNTGAEISRLDFTRAREAFRSTNLSPAAGRAEVVEECARAVESLPWHVQTSPKHVRARIGTDYAAAIRALAPASPTGGQASSPVVTEAPWTLADLRAANEARQAAWCPDQVPDLSFRGNELGGETGEALNVVKKLERERHGWRGSRATVNDLAEEIADVVICADLLAMTAGIDLMAAVRAKFDATSAKVGLPHRLAALPARAAEQAGGWQDVLAERRRQVEVEGWTPKHDDQHRAGEMATAAGVYALVSTGQFSDVAKRFWPWDFQWWKPCDARRNLVKAGALILAEIDRLDRLPAPPRAAEQPTPAVDGGRA